MLQGGKYRIVRFLGAGGFGCTYEAVFESGNVHVAIKEFFPHELCNRDAAGHMSVAADSRIEFVERLQRKFVDEATTLFAFNDLYGVIKVSDIFEENGTSYYVMDYIDGRSLGSVITTDGPLPETEAVRIIREAGNALAGVHGRNCLHLDIKPDNIMLDSDKHPILIDFGISKQYTREDGCNTSTLMGCTPGYAPLEQMKGNVRSFYPATDIYALGATLYTLVTGLLPPDVSDMVNETESLKFPTNVSRQTRDAIEGAMQVKVKDRPETIASFLSLLPGPEETYNCENNKNANLPEPDNTSLGHDSNSHWSTKTVGSDQRLDQTKRNLRIAIVSALAAISIVIVWQLTPFHTAHNDFIATSQLNTVSKPEAKPTATPISNNPETIVSASTQYLTAPASSSKTETAMVAAYTDGGEYRAYLLSDWDGFNVEQRSKVTPVGIQLSCSGQKFIVALTDAGNGKEYKWEDKESYDYCVDINQLKNISAENVYEAKHDFGGSSNTNIILSFGRKNDIISPAALAASNYSLKGYRNWYLPASGQLLLIYENIRIINSALKKINGNSIFNASYWSSTEEDSANVWYVNMNNGYFSFFYKNATCRVRPIASVPIGA